MEKIAKMFFQEKRVAIVLAVLLLVSQHSNASIARTINGHDFAARLIRYDVKPAYQATFRKVVSDYVVYSLAQEGNVLSEAYYEQQDPNVVWVIERWRNKADAEKARTSIAFKSVEAVAATALTKPATTFDVKDLEPLTKQQWRNVVKKEDEPITIMLFVDAKAGTEERFKSVYHTAMPQFRGEPGVVTYQLSQLTADSTRFVTYEKFRNEDAFQYHLKFPPIQPVIDYLNTSIKKQPFQSGLHRLMEFAPLNRE